MPKLIVEPVVVMAAGNKPMRIIAATNEVRATVRLDQDPARRFNDRFQ